MKVLILGSSKQGKKVYRSVIDILKNLDLGIEILSSPIDSAEFDGPLSKRYKQSFEKLKTADLIIAEMSIPSTGEGMELREIENLQKRHILIAKKKSSVSGLVKGSPNLEEVVYYKNKKDLENKIRKRI